METSGNSGKRHIVAPLLAAATIIGGVYGLATQNERRSGRVVNEPVPCLVDGYNELLPPATTLGSDKISVVANSVLQLAFFTTSAEYNQLLRPITYGHEGIPLTNEQREARFKNFLEDKGIEAQAAPGVTLDDALNSSAGPYELAFNKLAFLPQDIVDASGLKKIIFIKDRDSTEDIIPKHHEGVLVLPATHEIGPGLANMVLDNHCSKAESFRILKSLYNTTRNSGFSYDPTYQYRPDIHVDYLGSDKGIFADTSSVRGPRLEFISLFSRAMSGYNWYSENDAHSALGKKQQLVQAVFDELVGVIVRDEHNQPMLSKSGRPHYLFDANSLQKMVALTSGIGARGPHPHDQALQIKQYDRRYRDAHTNQERAAAFSEYQGIQTPNTESPYTSPIPPIGGLPVLPKAVLTGQPSGLRELQRVGEFGFYLR